MPGDDGASERSDMGRGPREEHATEPIDRPQPWNFRLYVAGQTPKSSYALANLTRICEEYLAGICQIEIVDVLEHPHLARRDQILVIPTLIRTVPLPRRKIIGDLSHTRRVLLSLDLSPRL